MRTYQNRIKTIIHHTYRESEDCKKNDLDVKKNDLSIEIEKNICKFTSVNNQFQLFKLDSINLRNIFIEHGEKLIKWENENTSIIFLEEKELQD